MNERTASSAQALEAVLVEAALLDQSDVRGREPPLERFYSVADESSEAEASSKSDAALLYGHRTQQSHQADRTTDVHSTYAESHTTPPCLRSNGVDRCLHS